MTQYFNQNQNKDTVAMWLSKKGYLIPIQWMHEENIYNIDNVNLKNLAESNYLPLPQHWKKGEQLSIFDQAYFGKVPQLGNNQPSDQDEDGFTVAMMLAINNITIPRQWYHDPNIRNKYGYTVALYQARNGNIPDKQWNHDKYLRCWYSHQKPSIPLFYTVQNFLQEYHVKIPDQWKYIPLNKCENNDDIQKAQQGQYQLLESKKPDYQNLNGFTVALLQARKGFIPSRQQMHSYDIKDCFSYNINDYLEKRGFPTPYHWHDDDITIFDQAIFGEIPDINGHSPDEQNEDGWTVAMILARLGKEIPEQWKHNPTIQNNRGNTVAMFISSFQKRIPEQCWNHDPTLTNLNKQTVAMILSNVGIIPPKHWYHNPSIQSVTGNTVAIYLAYNKILPPIEWMNSQNIKNKQNKSLQQILHDNKLPSPCHYHDNDMTIFDQACFKIIPKLDFHDPNEQDQSGFTVAMILTINKIEVPVEWRCSPEIENEFNQSIFDIFINQNENPPKWTSKNSNSKNQSENTQAMRLALGNRKIPDYLFHDPTIRNKQGMTVAMILAQQRQDIGEEWYHDPLMSDDQGRTVALLQAYSGRVPDKHWYHNKYYRGKIQFQQNSIIQLTEYCTVQDLLKFNNKEVPIEWRCDFVDQEGNTHAMQQVQQNQIPDDESYHDPMITNSSDVTVAILMTQKGIIPPMQWMYNMDIKIDNKHCLRDCFIEYQLPIPQEWRQKDKMTIFEKAMFRIVPDIAGHSADEQDQDGWTVAMILTVNKMEIPQQWEHDPTIQNKYGYTVAMLMAKNGQQIPKQWQHDPYIRSEDQSTIGYLYAYNGKVPLKQYVTDPNYQYGQDRNTIAMELAYNNLQIPTYCYHNPLIKNYNDDTVALLLARTGVVPSKNWMHDIYTKNKGGDTIKILLEQKGYIYLNEQFIPNCKTQNLKTTCQICFSNKEKQFILTNCGHKVCLKCFQQLMKNDNIDKCPLCREQFWYQILKKVDLEYSEKTIISDIEIMLNML